MIAGERVRVLLVEDVEDARVQLAELFRATGRAAEDLVFATSADEAIEHLRGGPFHVVLVDDRLGRDHGLELIARARRLEVGASFVLLATRRVCEDHLRAGADDCLEKAGLTAPVLDRALRYAAQRERLQRGLRASQRSFRQLADAAPAMLYVTDAAGEPTFVNRSWLDFLGLVRGGEVAAAWRDAIHPDDRERVAAHLAHALHQQAGVDVTYRVRRQDGDCRWVRDEAGPHFGDDGRLEGYAGVWVDVTEARRGEEDPAPAPDPTGQGSRLKAQFLANMSHEVRTPMNGIIGMTGLLLDTALAPEQRELAEIVQKSADALLAVVNDILDFSKLETGRLQVEPVDFDLRRLVEDTLSLIADRAHDKGLELLADLAPDLATGVRGDPARIRQVLTNLVGNAIKFTEKGEVVVRLEPVAEGAGAAPAAWRIEVIDTGVGIVPEVRDQLFDPFMQADVSNTRRHGGTGLGLTISRQLVELMGGRLGLESEPGRGSRFWCELPLPPATTPVTETWIRPVGGLAPVLIVDDNVRAAAVLRRELEHAGIATQVAGGAEAALEQLHDRRGTGRPFKLVLIDRHMPERGGMTLAQIIRGDPDLRETKLVMLTSASHLPELETRKDVRLEAFLVKPVRQAQLRECLARLADRAGGGAGPARTEPGRPWRNGALRVLVAEDNVVNQKVALRHLSRLGHEGEAAEHGQKALEMLALQRYDVVLMDCQMPVLDGFETTQRIRRGDVPNLDPQVPIIALTAYAMEGDRQRCLAAGMNDFVPKPMRFEDLEAALERLQLRRQSQAGGGTAGVPVVLDLVQFEHLAELQDEESPTFVQDLIELFLRETARRLTEIEAAGREGDWRVVAQIAHTVKGASANLGGRLLQGLCARVEEQARLGHGPVALDFIGRLAPAFEQLRGALDLQKKRIALENSRR